MDAVLRFTQKWAPEIAFHFGVSFGRACAILKALWFRVWRGLAAVTAGSVILYVMPHAVRRTAEFCASLPPVSAGAVLGMFVLGFVIFALTAFVYVLFRFLHVIIQTDVGIARDAVGLANRAGSWLPPSRKQKATEGTFLPDDDNQYYLQEQLSELQKGGHLQGVDLKDIMAEGKDIDFEKLKKSAVGIDV